MNWSRKRRNRKLPYPEGYVPLSEVFDATGREIFGELWDGREGAADILESTSEQLLGQLRDMEAKSADPEEREQAEWERRDKRPGTIRLGPSLLIPQIRRQLDPDCKFGLWEPEGDLGFEELSPKQISKRKRIRERVEWADQNYDEALDRAAASYKERYERWRRGKEIEDSLRTAFGARRPVAYLFERATGNLLQVLPSKWHAENFDVSFITSRASWKEATATGSIERKGEIVLAEDGLKERVILPDREQEAGRPEPESDTPAPEQPNIEGNDQRETQHERSARSGARSKTRGKPGKRAGNYHKPMCAALNSMCSSHGLDRVEDWDWTHLRQRIEKFPQFKGQYKLPKETQFRKVCKEWFDEARTSGKYQNASR